MGSGAATQVGWATVTRVLRATVLGALLGAGTLCGSAAASTPAAPTIQGAVTDTATLSGAVSVAVSGHYAYATAYFSGRLVAVDISDPAHPVIAGASPYAASLQNASTVKIVGPYAYVASKNRNASTTSNDDGTGNSLTILDIAADPAHPAIVGVLHDPATLFGAYGVAAAGHYAYVAAQGHLHGQPTQPDTSTGSFDIIDTINAAVPATVATIANDALPAPWTGSNALQHVTAVAISTHYAYLTSAYANRLTVIDVANPSRPAIVASLQDAASLNSAVDIAIEGRYAYIVGQGSARPTLTVVDISKPAAPRVVGSLSSPLLKGAYRVRVRGAFAYVASVTASTVSIIDISNPVAPRLAAGLYDRLVHLNSVSGVDLDPSGRFAVVASPTLASQSPGVYPPFPFQPGGPTITGTVTTILLDPSPDAVHIAKRSIPHSPTSSRSVSFTFAGNDIVTSMLCRLDRGPSLPCTTPTRQRYSSLRAGRHTFTVLAVNSAGHIASARARWVIGPAPSLVRSSLLHQLRPTGNLSTINALLKRGSYVLSLRVPGPGSASVSWYFLSPGARPVLVGMGRVSYALAGSRRLTIKLTRAGRRLMTGALTLPVTAQGSFTPVGEGTVKVLKAFQLALSLPAR